MASSELIMKKLKKDPQHKRKSQKELERLARELTNTADIKEKFDQIFQDGQEMVLRMVEQQDDDLLHRLERVAEHQRVKHDTARALHLPIQLSLQRLSIHSVDLSLPGVVQKFSTWLNFEYGAFHAVLTVGNVAIDWRRNSIVQPKFDPLSKSEFKANVGDQGEWFQQQGICQIDMSLADRERNSEKKLDILCESMTEKARLIARLVDVIVNYNQNKRYQVFQCNCQDFVRDAMAALGIKKPVKFQGNLQKYFERLKGSNVKIPPELRGHENLDVYVTAHLQDLERQDMEYLQCLYFKAHLPALEKARDPNEWQCDISTCMRDELDTMIGMHALPFNQFLGTAPVHNQSPMEISLSKKVLPQQNHLQPQHQQIQILSQFAIRQSPFRLSLVDNGHDKSSREEGYVERCLCINDCGMHGEQNVGGLCSQCLKKEQEATREKGRSDYQVKRQESLPDTRVEAHLKMPHLQEQDVSDNSLFANPDLMTGCRMYGCEFFGNTENLFYCSQCFKENTEKILMEFYDNASLSRTTQLPPQDVASGEENVNAEHSQQADHQEPQKCYNCRPFFGNEEYQGLCNTCFVERTKVDIKLQVYSGDNDRHLRISDKEHTIGQRALSGHGAMVQHSDSSYRILTERGLASVPLPSFRSAAYSTNIMNDDEDDQCYLCFDKQVRRKNPVCDRHAQKMKEILTLYL